MEKRKKVQGLAIILSMILGQRCTYSPQVCSTRDIRRARPQKDQNKIDKLLMKYSITSYVVVWSIPEYNGIEGRESVS
jgi:uncharacterized membrane protein